MLKPFSYRTPPFAALKGGSDFQTEGLEREREREREREKEREREIERKRERERDRERKKDLKSKGADRNSITISYINAIK